MTPIKQSVHIFSRYESLPDFGNILIAGVDEAGRGALAGPVFAAAVILNYDSTIEDCRDSKQLSPKKRTILEKKIKQQAICWSVAQSSVTEIDSIRILQASLLAMQRAVNSLKIKPELVLIDGNQVPSIASLCHAVISGDARVEVISAASILAKTARDKEMERLDLLYSEYNFKSHKGYPTPEHLQCLKQNGACEIHRQSYQPVKQITEIYNKEGKSIV